MSNKVWQNLTGTMQSIFKIGRYRLKSYIDKFAIESRQGAPVVEFSPTKLKLLGKTMIIGDVIPTTGSYDQGDIIWNNDFYVGAPAFWLCTASGTPGTWQAISSTGAISFQGVKIIGDGGNTLGSIELVPNDNVYYNGQFVRIRPTVALDANHIHIERGGPNADLFLGDDDHYVKLDHNRSTAIGVPEAYIDQSFTLVEASTEFTAFIVIPIAGNPWTQYLVATNTVTLPNSTVLTVISVADDGTNKTLVFSALTGVLNIGDVVTIRYAPRKEWVFGDDGAITFPDASRLVTAFIVPIGGFIEIVNNKTYPIFTATSYYSIKSFRVKTTTGSCTLSVQVDGGDVIGLNDLTVTSTEQFLTPTSLNNIYNGDRLSVVITANTGAVDLEFTLVLGG